MVKRQRMMSNTNMNMSIIDDDSTDDDFIINDVRNQKRNKNYSKNSSSSDNDDIFIPKSNNKSKNKQVKDLMQLDMFGKLETNENNNNSKTMNYSSFKAMKESRMNSNTHQPSKGASHKDLNQYEWFRNPKDFNGISHSNPLHNPSQIFIPAKYLKIPYMTPAQSQYWQLKKSRMDGVLFFKQGKFYELYYSDAEAGHRLFGLSIMAGAIKHTGFPEQSFDKYAQGFVHYGYQVYRVEQMETSKAQKARGGKVVNRELCEVYTPGVIIDAQLVGNSSSNYLLSIVEADDQKNMMIEVQQMTGHEKAYAFCFVDCSTAEFNIGYFMDDRNLSHLRTLIVQIEPTEILYPKNISLKLLSFLKRQRNVTKTPLIPLLEFYDADKCRILLESGNYWNTNAFPNLLKNGEIWNNDGILNAIGGILYVLQKTLHDNEILPHSEWHFHDPIDPKCNDFLTLDGSTLANLEILQNQNGNIQGTLLQFIDRTVTPFGKRLLKKWLRTPLANIQLINDRLNAVQYLMDNDELLNELRLQMGKLPDLERLISNLAVLGTKNRMMDRAIMFETIWNEKKVKKLCDTLSGLEIIQNILNMIDNRYRSQFEHKSNLLNIITLREDDENDDDTMTNCTANSTLSDKNTRTIPHFTVLLEKFILSFDREEAESDSIIRPTAGQSPVYDKCCVQINANTSNLNSILVEIEQTFNSELKWYHPKRPKICDHFQIEIPRKLNLRIPQLWIKTGRTVNCFRYQTLEIRELLEARERLMSLKDNILCDCARATFERFAMYGYLWNKLVKNFAMLDCLLSLAYVSKHAPMGNMCRPEFVPVLNQKAFLELRTCIHPCLGTYLSDTQCIPNDTVMGCEENEANFVIVTGPNMGGKSTLLRQTCIAVILAHVGCFVPALKCRLTPVDRIFTRVGANDRVLLHILAGQSTFYVELEETATILKHATSNSLIILDELGRGTSTFDGQSIASAVAKSIVENIAARCLFATHYHGLCDAFMADEWRNLISMYFMAFLISDDKKVTFLYKFTKGICKESHGINCARMAGLNEDILYNARKMSKYLHDRIHNFAHLKNHRILVADFHSKISAVQLVIQEAEKQPSKANEILSDVDDIRMKLLL